MIPLTLESLLQVLRKKKYDANIQAETKQIYIVFKINDKEYPLFIRVFEDSDLLQLLVFIPCQLKPTAVNDVARLLHLFNKELDIPGFGMDESTGMIFFRSIIPCVKHKVEETHLDSFLDTIQLVCKTFAPPIEAIAYGITTFDEVLKKANEAK